MTLTDLPMAPQRRDVKGMTEQLRILRAGDQLSVTFKTAAYGIFTVDGAAVFSPSVKTFMVGSLFIESSLKPEKTVHAIERRDAPDVAVVGDDREAMQDVVDRLRHGDVVAATFEQAPHGRFTITGPVVQTVHSNIFTVGHWFLAVGGRPAERVAGLSVIADAGTHHVPVPSRITTWDTDNDPTS